MRRRRWLLAALLALGSLPGCHGAVEGGPRAVAPRSEARRPLWALAPAGATFGMVVHDGAAARLMALLPFAEGTPLQELAAQLVGEISPDLPLNLVATRSFAELGLDPRLGMALFSPAGEGSSLFVLPVGDRDRFRRALHVQVKQRGGREIDEIGRGYLCAITGGRYLCARTTALIDQAVAPHDSELARAIRGLAADERGEIEVWADAKAQEMQPVTSELRVIGDISAGWAVAHLRASSLQIEAQLAGEMRTFLAEALRGEAPPPALAEQLLAAPTALRWRLDPALIVARLLPVGDAEIRAALLDQLTGEIALMTGGDGVAGFTIALPLRDAAPVVASLPRLCAGLVKELERFGALRGPASEGRCSAAFQPGDRPFPLVTTAVSLRVSVEGKRLVLRVGQGDGLATRDEGDPAGAAARAALVGPESFALHARALQLGPDVGAEGALRGAFPWLDPRSLAIVEEWNRLGAHLEETTFAARVRADGIRLHLDLRTLAADPPEALAAYEAALGRRFAGDAPGYHQALASLEAEFPGTRVARRARLIRRGGPWLGAGAMVLAALAWLERR